MNKDSYDDMLAAVQAFHDKHDFKNTGGEELTYRVALMAEELGWSSDRKQTEIKEVIDVYPRLG